VIGKVNCYQGGHELTNIFLRKLFQSKHAYVIEESTNSIIKSKETNHFPKIAVNA
jgi:UDP-3-O-acyl-N-acetylglucosamine deacetylase